MTFTDLSTLTLSIVSKNYTADNVTVTVEWTQQVGAIYNTTVTLLPPASSLFAGSNGRNLTLLYNTGYNFSVVAFTRCESATSSIVLNYSTYKPTSKI